MSVESNSRLLWFCITAISDWLKKLAPLCQPITSKTQTNRDSLARIFARLHVFASSFHWFIGLSVSFVVGQSDYRIYSIKRLGAY